MERDHNNRPMPQWPITNEWGPSPLLPAYDSLWMFDAICSAMGVPAHLLPPNEENR